MRGHGSMELKFGFIFKLYEGWIRLPFSVKYIQI
jgi:hypothetical protein